MKDKTRTACKRRTRGSHVLHSCWFWKYNNASCLDFQLSFLEETRANPPSRRGLKSSSHNLGCIINGSTRIIPMILAELKSGYTSAAASTLFCFQIMHRKYRWKQTNDMVEPKEWPQITIRCPFMYSDCKNWTILATQSCVPRRQDEVII